MAEAWFKPKRYGWGAQPKNWKGWAATFAFVAILIGQTYAFLGVAPGASIGVLVIWGLVSIGLTIGFIRFSRAKTDGVWRWRWGEDE